MEVELDLSADWGGFRLAIREALRVEGVTALFGPSGAGKSTVLSTIAGFLPDLGHVTVGGQVWQGRGRALPAHRRPVGMVFQDGRLFDHLTVVGNLQFAARRADADGPEVRLEDAVEALDLSNLLRRWPVNLSGGERQRVAIARALLTRPRLMLMDEPLAALDRARKASLLGMIAELPERFGLPVLYVSHQLDEIVQIASSLIAIREGRITGQGPVADMIAAMDPVLTGRFEAGSVLEGPVVELRPAFAMAAIGIAGGRLWMPDVGGAVLGDRVRVRVRARDVSLALGRNEEISIRNQIAARVVGIEADDGAFAEIALDCHGQALRARISRMALADLDLREGLEVFALIKSIAFDRRLTSK